MKDKFEEVFKILHDSKLDESLSGQDSSQIIYFKETFKELWDYDLKKDPYRYYDIEDSEAVKKWFFANVEMATHISQDDKWDLENFYYKFELLYKIKQLLDS